MSDRALRSWAYGLTVAGGALILAGSGMMAFFWAVAAGNGWTGPWWMPGHMGLMTIGSSLGWFVIWGVVTGTAVLWAGVRMRPDGPGGGTLEGTAAIVASALSFPAMGGFMFGALLGIVGGALSLVEHAQTET